MANKKLTIRQQSQLLVQNILSKNTLSANRLLKKLIAEAEQRRQKDIRKLLLQEDEGDAGSAEAVDDSGDDLGGDDLSEGGDDLDEGGDEFDESGDDLDEGGDESEQTMSNSQTQQIIDDSLAIQCEINAKRICVLFDTIASLKQALDDKELDPSSKEYIKFDITISYYSEKLQEFQGKTNPAINQSKLEEALDKITDALEQLKGQLGIENSDVDADIDTPEQVKGDSDQNDQEDGQSIDQEDGQPTDQEDNQKKSDESDEQQEQLE